MSPNRDKAEGPYDLAKARMWVEEADVIYRKATRISEPPEHFKKSKADLFNANELERVKETKTRLVIDQIWDRIKLESKNGRRHAIVYSIPAEEIAPYPPQPKNHQSVICNPDWLKGTARRIHDHCDKYFLKPTIERWNGGHNNPSLYGFNIVIHW